MFLKNNTNIPLEDAAYEYVHEQELNIGASDTETRNLLEDGADDEDDELDSDGANTINAAHSNASSQIAQVCHIPPQL